MTSAQDTATAPAAEDIPYGRALANVLDAAELVEDEPVQLSAALGRVASRDIRAPRPLPPFDRAAMDGYAVAGADCVAGAPLRLSAESVTGATPPPLAAGRAAPISTGAPLPAGADTVIPLEHVTERDGAVVLERRPDAGQHVRVAGEDVRPGEVLAQAGVQLRPVDLAVLTAAGVTAVDVRRRPRAAVLITGDEVQRAGEVSRPAGVFDVNGLLLGHLLSRCSADSSPPLYLRDDRAQIVQAVTEQLTRQPDVLLISGGASVGRRDFVRPALSDAGVVPRFWRMQVKPGKPVWFGTCGRTLVFVLPGNPLACLVIYLALVAPALAAMLGVGDGGLPLRTVRLEREVGPDARRTRFVATRLRRDADAVVRARPLDSVSSHMVGSFRHADGFLVLPPSAARWPSGQLVGALELAPHL